MNWKLVLGIFIPFAGTSLGSAMVFLMRNTMSTKTSKILTGFAAGVMMAASFWSLLEPSIADSSTMGKLSFLPAAIGFMAGIFFLLLLDVITPHEHMDESEEGPKTKLQKTTKMILAVTLHNIPEGMAVGVVYAGWLSSNANITYTGALTLALGIAIQNFPEGAIVSMPLRETGMKKGKTFWMGVLSGAVEPIGSIITILFATQVSAILPYLLAFAAGAMIYVIVEELIPEMSAGKHSNSGTISFSVGFVLMMILDVALG